MEDDMWESRTLLEKDKTDEREKNNFPDETGGLSVKQKT